MTTFNWTISAVERAVNLNGLQNVIQMVHWRYSGIDENDITAEVYDVIKLPTPNVENFIPFHEITTSDIIIILETLLDIPNMQQSIQLHIDLLINPVTITGPLYN